MSDELWSIPPIISTSPPGGPTGNLILAQGIIYEIIARKPFKLQNISENEDDEVEFSEHGDRDGVWGILNTHSLLGFNSKIYILNRSHKENVVVTFFNSNYCCI